MLEDRWGIRTCSVSSPGQACGLPSTNPALTVLALTIELAV
jgi:hypothetical protein